MALGQITVNSLEGIANANPQAKVIEVKDVKKLNLFGLTRMLETVIVNASRVHYVWDYVAAHLDFLANAKFLQFRPLAVDAMTCMIINIFDSKKDGAETTAVPKWEGNEWQAVLLSPLVNAIQGGHSECIRGVISNMRHIIEVFYV